MYDCSSLTWASSSDSWRTRECKLVESNQRAAMLPSASNGSDGASASGT